MIAVAEAAVTSIRAINRTKAALKSKQGLCADQDANATFKLQEN